MPSRKDKLLQRIDSDTLLRLAEGVSESPTRSGATRAELLKLVKESLSIEEIKRKAKLVEDPAPRELTRNELTAGGVGQVLLAASGAINNIAYYLAITGGSEANYYQTMAAYGLVSSILFLIFAILLSVSIMKIARKLGGSPVGTATSLFGSITAITGLLFYGLLILGVATSDVYFIFNSSNALYAVLLISYSGLLVITMALLGVFFLVHREYSPSSELWMAGGIIYIVAGAYQFSFSSLIYLSNTLFVAAIIGAVCFLAKKAEK